ncbi:hypothetical protein ACA29_02980 [Lederbergia galactosidilytica]|uniref:Uncharacterized protein n=1 Tax=Lederbergia galactosidilytica TaxID=217031 RepID=A0A0Q9Y7K8_9BACI|nr:hypothetical protein ACA29_02980 [Lederbergia galactosidilytica]
MKNKTRFAIALLLLVFAIAFIPEESVGAAIPDGNATGAGFNPFVVDSTIKRNWKSTRGGKEYSPRTGRKLQSKDRQKTRLRCLFRGFQLFIETKLENHKSE